MVRSAIVSFYIPSDVRLSDSSSEIVSTLRRTSCLISTSSSGTAECLVTVSSVSRSGKVVTKAQPVSCSRESLCCFWCMCTFKLDKRFLEVLWPSSRGGAPKLFVQSGLSVQSFEPAAETCFDLLRMCRILPKGESTGLYLMESTHPKLLTSGSRIRKSTTIKLVRSS